MNKTGNLLKVRLYLLARLLLGGLFIYAGVEKIFHPADFAKIVYNYQILPDALVNLTALLLPWLELIIGICLVIGFWMPGAVLLANGLLWIFFLALLFNYYRGLDIQCGCFSTRLDPDVAYRTSGYLFRETVLVLVAGLLMFHQLRE